MRLSEANQNDVVRNTSNDSFYRYERPAENRARIRPLELFPNGLLIAKPTDTIVAADLDVEYVATWSEGLVVSGIKGSSRTGYEREREQLREQLKVLEAEAVMIEPKQRGSFANRLKAVKLRLSALESGLEDLGTEPLQIDMAKLSIPAFRLKQMVCMPSGAPAQFLGLLPQGHQLLATVATRVASGAVLMIQVDPQALRPSNCRYMATL